MVVLKAGNEVKCEPSKPMMDHQRHCKSPQLRDDLPGWDKVPNSLPFSFSVQAKALQKCVAFMLLPTTSSDGFCRYDNFLFSKCARVRRNSLAYFLFHTGAIELRWTNHVVCGLSSRWWRIGCLWFELLRYALVLVFVLGFVFFTLCDKSMKLWIAFFSFKLILINESFPNSKWVWILDNCQKCDIPVKSNVSLMHDSSKYEIQRKAKQETIQLQTRWVEWCTSARQHGVWCILWWIFFELSKCWCWGSEFIWPLCTTAFSGKIGQKINPCIITASAAPLASPCGSTTSMNGLVRMGFHGIYNQILV